MKIIQDKFFKSNSCDLIAELFEIMYFDMEFASDNDSPGIYQNYKNSSAVGVEISTS